MILIDFESFLPDEFYLYMLCVVQSAEYCEHNSLPPHQSYQYLRAITNDSQCQLLTTRHKRLQQHKR